MLDKTKTDPELGKEIAGMLITEGIQTPMNNNPLTDKKKLSIINKSFTKILDTLGMDLSDDSLIETPRRMAKMYVNELFWGLKTENFPKITVVDNKMKYDEMVIVKDLTVMSNCEHHLTTIDGLATISYIPKDNVLGLSKFGRIVEYFSKRPQIQERLTEQISATLKYILGTDEVAVSIRAKHYCMAARGIEDSSSYTITNKLSGSFRDNPETRSEFIRLIK